MYSDKKVEIVSPIVALAITIVIVVVIALCLLGIVKVIDAYQYNNGVCRRCGGSYEYIEAVGSYSGAEYIYACNQCGGRIELSEYVITAAKN